jgi:hypothetical protein
MKNEKRRQVSESNARGEIVDLALVVDRIKNRLPKGLEVYCVVSNGAAIAR